MNTIKTIIKFTSVVATLSVSTLPFAVAETALASQSQTAHENALPTTLDYSDTFNLEYAANPLFIDGGKRLIYERRSMDIMQDTTKRSFWQVSLDGTQHRPLFTAAHSVSQATLSHDGNKLLYVGHADGAAKLYVHFFDTGSSVQLSDLPSAPSSLTWSHDDSHIAFTLFTEAKPKSLFTGMPAKPKGAQWADNAKYIEKTRYRADGAGYLPDGYQQIYIMPSDGGTPRQLTTGAYPNAGALTFSADNQWLYYSTNPDENYSMAPLTSDIFKVHVNTGNIEQVTQTPGPEYNVSLSPDGKKLAYIYVDDRKLSYQNGYLAVLDLASGKTTKLTPKLDRAIAQFEWGRDSKELVFAYDDHGKRLLASVNLTGKIRNLRGELGGQALGRPYTSGQFALSQRGDIAFTQAHRQQPADLALLNTSSKIETLTNLNQDALGHLNLARVEDLPVTSSVDQRKIEAWVALPPNFDPSKKYPLILEIHGGPHAAYGPQFSMEVQLMAAKGYVVVWSNPRGSSSYGEDFANLIHHNYPSEDYNDLMDVVDATIAKGYIDTDNLFITGGSGGGVLTAWSIGKTDRFAAAVVAKPVINWLSFALTADSYPYFTQYWMPGMPWEIHEHLWQHSPLSLVGNVTTPTLLLTGEADYRTPISESEQFYQALKLRGIDAAMVRIPGAPHGIASKPSRLIQKVGNIVAWFDRYQRTSSEK